MSKPLITATTKYRQKSERMVGDVTISCSQLSAAGARKIVRNRRFWACRRLRTTGGSDLCFTLRAPWWLTRRWVAQQVGRAIMEELEFYEASLEIYPLPGEHYSKPSRLIELTRLRPPTPEQMAAMIRANPY